MNKKPSFFLVFFVLLLLGAAFFTFSPKKGAKRGSVNLSPAVAEAGTLESAPTYATLFSYPSVENVFLNSGSDIDLNENTTKKVDIIGDVVDYDGCDDISVNNITGVIYLDGSNASCSANPNKCYTGGDVTCSTTTCNDGTAEVTCSANIWFHANPDQWLGSIKVTDGSGNTAEGASSEVTVNELKALLVDNVIHYGALTVGNTTTVNEGLGVTTVGNVGIDCSLSGTDMTSSSGGTIEVENQKYDLSDVAYASLGNTLLASDATFFIKTGKPMAHPATEIDIIYWGLRAPSGVSAGTDYEGVATFTATPNNPCEGTTSVTYESTTYDTVGIGNQCWLAENLNVGTAINGTVEQSSLCDGTDLEKYCYENSTSDCVTYGGLYQWDQAMCGSTSSSTDPSGVQGICPDGWHIPSDAEWAELEIYLSESTCDTTRNGAYDCDPAASKMATAAELWNGASSSTIEDHADFGTSGFDALPAGLRGTDGSFNLQESNAYLWSATELDASNAWNRRLYHGDVGVYRHVLDKGRGFSVRCLRD